MVFDQTLGIAEAEVADVSFFGFNLNDDRFVGCFVFTFWSFGWADKKVDNLINVGFFRFYVKCDLRLLKAVNRPGYDRFGLLFQLYSDWAELDSFSVDQQSPIEVEQVQVLIGENQILSPDVVTLQF